MIARFDSVAEFVAFAREHSDVASERAHGFTWDMNVSGPQACELAVAGDRSIVATMVADVAAFQVQSNEEMRKRWEPSVAGSRVDVPAFLSGSPLAMRRRAKRETEVRHVGIYVSTSCGANIHAGSMLRRGSAILGLLESLQASDVAVDLFLVDDMQGTPAERGWRDEQRALMASHGTWDVTADGDHVQVIRVESRPLDLSTCGFAIAHPAFARNVALPVGKLFGFQTDWSKTYRRFQGDAPGYRAALGAKIGMSDADIFVPPVDNRDQLISDPQGWIRTMVAQALHGAA